MDAFEEYRVWAEGEISRLRNVVRRYEELKPELLTPGILGTSLELLPGISKTKPIDMDAALEVSGKGEVLRQLLTPEQLEATGVRFRSAAEQLLTGAPIVKLGLLTFDVVGAKGLGLTEDQLFVLWGTLSCSYENVLGDIQEGNTSCARLSDR